MDEGALPAAWAAAGHTPGLAGGVAGRGVFVVEGRGVQKGAGAQGTPALTARHAVRGVGSSRTVRLCAGPTTSRPPTAWRWCPRRRRRHRHYPWQRPQRPSAMNQQERQRQQGRPVPYLRQGQPVQGRPLQPEQGRRHPPGLQPRPKLWERVLGMGRAQLRRRPLPVPSGAALARTRMWRCWWGGP